MDKLTQEQIELFQKVELDKKDIDFGLGEILINTDILSIMPINTLVFELKQFNSISLYDLYIFLLGHLEKYNRLERKPQLIQFILKEYQCLSDASLVSDTIDKYIKTEQQDDN